MTTPRPYSRQPKQLDAGIFQAEISSFALRLAAEGKAAKTIRTYTEAVRWFAATCLPGQASRDQLGAGQQPGHPAVDGMAAGPLQHRLCQQPVPRPAAVLQMAGRRRRAARPDGRAAAAARHRQAGPGLHGQELTRLEQACAGRSFAQRRDTAIIAVFTATGIRLSELAGLRGSDVDLWQREITVRGKGGKDRIVRIGHQAARSLDRYQRARSRHPQAWRPQLWLARATGSRWAPPGSTR